MDLLTDIFTFNSGLILSAGGLIILVSESISENKKLGYWIALAALIGALIQSMLDIAGPTGTSFNGMFAYGGSAAFAAMIIIIGTLFSVILSHDYLKSIKHDESEVYAMILFGLVGMLTMAGSNDLITVFIGLETMSICLYVLAGLRRDEKEGIEAALKYFLLGAFSTGFFLYGIALLYGATGTTSFNGIAAGYDGSLLFWAGTGLLLTGFFFKISAVPFHMWTPDVYQGAPTTITAYMAAASKSATFTAFIFVLSRAFAPVAGDLVEVLTVVAVLTMVFGNIIALVQDNVKRMLAYSSIAHAGYAMIGLVSGSADGYSSVLFYLFAYTLMNVGAFGVVAYYEQHTNLDFTNIENYGGLGFKQPIMGIMLNIFLFSLAGIPPFVGFIGKYKVFASAINDGYIGLAIIGVLASAASVYYYLRVMVYMYFKDAKEEYELGTPSTFFQFGLIVLAFLTVYFGILPTEITKLISSFEWKSLLAGIGN